MSLVEADAPREQAAPSQPAAALDPEGRARTTRHGRRLIWRVVANVVTAAILIACFVPDPGLPATAAWPLDKLAHAAAFAAFAFFWRMAGLSPLLVLASGLLLAAATELGQGAFVPTRSAEPLDAFADIAGIAIGLGFARRFRSRPETAPRPGA